MKLINLTPHTINIVNDDGNPIVNVPASGSLARCKQVETVVGKVDGIQITRQEFGEVEGLPGPADNVMYIVSRLVKAACPDRDDVVTPGPLVRDDSGQPIGCKGLSL